MKGIKNILLGIVLIMVPMALHLIAEHGLFFIDFIIPLGLILAVYGYIQKE